MIRILAPILSPLFHRLLPVQANDSADPSEPCQKCTTGLSHIRRHNTQKWDSLGHHLALLAKKLLTAGADDSDNQTAMGISGQGATTRATAAAAAQAGKLWPVLTLHRCIHGIQTQLQPGVQAASASALICTVRAPRES